MTENRRFSRLPDPIRLEDTVEETDTRLSRTRRAAATPTGIS